MTTFRPLSTGQRSLYRHHRFHPGDTAYNLTTLTLIQGPLDHAALHAALASVLNGADSFKCRFVELDGVPSLEVDPGRIVQVDLHHRPREQTPAAFEAMVRQQAYEAQHRATQAAAWPLVRVSLYIESEARAFLLQSVPHLLLDGYGYAIYLDRVARRYNAGRGPQPCQAGPGAAEPQGWEDPAAGADRRSREFYAKEIGRRRSLELESLAQARDAQGVLRGRVQERPLAREPLDRWMKGRGLNPTRLFLSVYALLLGRMASERELVIGYAIPNRSAANRHAIGCFVNTAPMVLDLQGSQTFDQTVALVDQKLFRLHRYQDFDADQHPDLAPRMNALFTLYAQELKLALEGCECRALSIPRDHLVAEIRLTVEVRQDCYHLVFDLGRHFAELDVAGAFEQLLEAVMRQPEAAVQGLAWQPSVLGNAQARMALAERIEGLGLGQAFERVAATHRRKTALTQGDEAWTYEQLDRMSNRVARLLSQRATTNTCVVLALDRSPMAVAVLLAVLKLNKCYVPLDPRSPPERLDMIVEDLGQPFVITEHSGSPAWAGMGLERLQVECAALSDLPLPLVAEPESEAYIIYTSGSTGRPKGAVISQANLLSLILAGGDDFGFGPDDTWTQFHSLNFDFSIWELFGCLLHGGRLVLVDHDTTRDPARLHRLLLEQRVSILNHTPSEFKGLVAEDGRQAGRLSARLLFLGGEALGFSEVRDWVSRYPLAGCQVVNLYGPTEGTVLVTRHCLRAQDLDGRRSIVGQPIAGCAIYLWRPDGELAMRGIPGEIVMAGLGVGQGYLNRPEETAARFVTTPAGAGFRTGDLGRIGADGALEFLGRMDRQLKVRGYRIEPGEVEAALLGTGLVEACAVGRPGTPVQAEGSLLALVVPRSAGCQEAELRAALKQTLPPYMMPSRIVLLPQLPTTLNGKIDFDAVCPGAQAGPELLALKGRNDTERWLFELVAAKLPGVSFELRDNLLDVGLTSLDLVDLVSQLRERRPAGNLAVSDVFDHPNVQALAHFLDHGRAAQAVTAQGGERAKRRRALMAGAGDPPAAPASRDTFTHGR